MKILSWNVCIYYDTLVNKRDVISVCDNIVQCVKEQDPDILCLQEASKDLINRFIDEKYFSCSETLTHGGICVTLIKKQMKGVKTSDYFQCGTNSLIYEKLNISNVHMTPGSSNKIFRNSQSLEILNHIKSLPQSSLIIIGDTNMTDEESISNMNDAGENIHTWYNSFFDKNSNETQRYDRAYTSEDVKIKYFKVLDIYKGYSDHYPILLITED